MDNQPELLVPPIKSQGIKTKLVPWIRSVCGGKAQDRWVEPFMGSGVVAFNVAPRAALLADTNPHIIEFYRAIQNDEVTPATARAHLEREGAQLSATAGEHYYIVRERFNAAPSPLDFLFLNRACFNGMMRFNRAGGFNVPFCRKPARFAPAYVTKICNQIARVQSVIAAGHFVFACQPFETTIAQAEVGDLIYCDPPYIGRHTDYYNGWSEGAEHRLNQALRETPANFALSTWHSNDFRRNEYLERFWSSFTTVTRPHFYHVGGKVQNRNSVLEALVTRIDGPNTGARQAQ